MSGHSHAKTVMHKKIIDANKRGAIFSKLARVISIAAKDGKDPEMNSKLRRALDEARQANMPKDNIEKAISRGSGKTEGENLEEFSYEALGPGGVSFIIEGITDNKNRTAGEIKQILQKYNGKIAGEGSIKWSFEKKGVIILRITNLYEYTNKQKEKLELKTIEAGAEDFKWRVENEEEFLEITTKPEDLDKVKKGLEDNGLKTESSYLDWRAKDEIVLSEKEKASFVKLFDELDENDSVQNVSSNIKNL